MKDDVKHEIAKAQEVLDEVTQVDEEKGAEAVKKLQGESQKKEAEQEAKIKEFLVKKRKGNDSVYMTALAQIAVERMALVDWPKGYKHKVTLDGRNLGMTFSDDAFKDYGQGFRACGEHEIDLNAIHVLGTRCENTVDYIRGELAWQKDVGKTGMYDKNGKFKTFNGKKK